MSKWHDEVGKKRWCLIKFFIIFISKGEDENMYCPDDKKVIEFKFKKTKKQTKNLKMCRRRCMMKNARYIPILNIWVKNSFLFEKKN